MLKIIKMLYCIAMLTMIASPATAQYLGEVGVVRSDDGSLNIRSAASTAADITGVLQNGDAVIVREVMGNWVRVTQEAGAGWVYAPLLALPSVEVMTQLIADNPQAAAGPIKTVFERFDGRALQFYYEQVGDFSALSQLPDLKELLIEDFELRDVSSLGTLVSLEVLTLDGVPLVGPNDMTALGHLTGLKELNILFGVVPDVSPLANLTGLERLTLYQTDTTDIAPLSTLIRLQVLDLSQNPVSDLTPLANLTALRTLSLNEMSALRDLSPIAGLPALRTLHLEGSFNAEIESLSQNEKLEIERRASGG